MVLKIVVEVRRYCYSPDGTKIALCSDDTTVKVRNPNTLIVKQFMMGLVEAVVIMVLKVVVEVRRCRYFPWWNIASCFDDTSVKVRAPDSFNGDNICDGGGGSSCDYGSDGSGGS